MDLDTLITEAAPARLTPLDGPDSPHAVDLFHRIVAKSPTRAPRRVPTLIGAAAVGTAAVAVFVAIPGSPAGPESAAAAVLRGAALTAGHQPAATPRPGQYLYVKTIQQNRFDTGTTFSACVQTIQDWAAPDGSGRQVSSAPAAKGCPGSFPTQSFPRGQEIDGSVFPGATRLPTDPAALERYIVRHFEGGGSDAAATFEFAGTFLQSGAPPKVRSALYRMIERLPGIASLGPLTDRIGRRGVGVAYSEHGVRDVLIVDPRTSAVLEQEGVVVDPAKVVVPPGAPRYRAGEVINYTVYVASGVVNSRTATP